MHYYQFNIADYRKDTTHLSRLEHSIYRDLIDWCYLDEAPIPLDLSLVSRKLRLCSTDDERALNNVLTDFFECTNEGYTQKRCEAVIAAHYDARKNHWGKKLTKEQRCTMEAARNAAKVNATPRWLTADHHAEIARIYAACRRVTDETGIPHEVDHIVPLRGADVCGLHAPWNLRVITAEANRRKSNLLMEVA